MEQFNNIVEQVLSENSLKPFLKFYYAFKRKQLPEHSIVWECLQILEEYYREYIEWYNADPRRFHPIPFEPGAPTPRVNDIFKIYNDFKTQLVNIQTAIKSNNLPKMIEAVDTGINQWHYDFPVIAHLGMAQETEEGEKIADKIADILIGLGKLPRESPYGPVGR